jgi:hypothetical protein
MREDCCYVVNHQSCEGNDDTAAMRRWREHGQDGSHRLACREAGVDPERAVLMSTAANMQCAALSQATHRELTVTVVATAGVLGNAARAGDRAAWHETETGCDKADQFALGAPLIPVFAPSSLASAPCLFELTRPSERPLTLL